MISIVAASIASRRRHLLQRTHDQQDPSPPRHRHRPRALSEKVTLVKQTSAISAPECESSASSVVAEDEYAHAMAARARLHARLRKSALVTCPTRASSSAPVLGESSRLEPTAALSTGDPSNVASSAPVLHESTSTCKYSRPSRLEANAAPSTGDPSNVHTHLTTIALSKSQTGPFIDSKIPSSAPIHNPSKQAEEFLLETDDCSICLESFSTGKILICWPCQHRFHYKCLTTWLAAHAQCPNCRAYILKVSSPQASVGLLNTLHGLHFEKNVTSWKVNLRTSSSIN